MKDKNNTITVYSMLFSFCLEVFSKTLYLLLGKGGVHKSGSFFHLVKLPFHLFECKQKNIFDYYLKCYDSSVCFAPWNRICFRQKFLLLSHKMAIPAQKKGVLRRDCSQSKKNSSLKVAYTNNEAAEKTKICFPGLLFAFPQQNQRCCYT